MKFPLLTVTAVVFAVLCSISSYVAWHAVLQSNQAIDQLKLQLLMLHHGLEAQESRQRALEPKLQEQLKAVQDDSAQSTRQFGALVLRVQQSLWEETASQTLFGAATESRLSRLEKGCEMLATSTKDLAAELERTRRESGAQLDQVRTDLASRISSLSTNIDTSVQSLDGHLKTLDKNLAATQNRLDTLPLDRIRTDAITAAQAQSKSIADALIAAQARKQQEQQAYILGQIDQYYAAAAQIEEGVRRRNPAQRVWNDEDQRALRQAMLEHLIILPLSQFDPQVQGKFTDAFRHACTRLAYMDAPKP